MPGPGVSGTLQPVAAGIPASQWRAQNGNVNAGATWSANYVGHNAAVGHDGVPPTDPPQFTRLRVIATSNQASGQLWVAESENPGGGLPWIPVASVTATVQVNGQYLAGISAGQPGFMIDVPLFSNWFQLNFINGAASTAAVYVAYVLL